MVLSSQDIMYRHDGAAKSKTYLCFLMASIVSLIGASLSFL